MNHPIYVIYNRWTGMGSIFDFLIMINDNLLQYIHKTIMREDGTKRNSQPLMRRALKKVAIPTRIGYNITIKYRWCFNDKSTAKTNIKSIYANI